MDSLHHSINQGRNTVRKLAEVFNDVDAHISLAQIIQKRLVKKTDIRRIAFENLDFSGVKDIIDLGCGFGFFTRGLKPYVLPGAKITGVDSQAIYKNHYLNACTAAGLQGKFLSRGISVLRSMKTSTFDLAICSYALYFFPHYIDQISRIIKDKGIVILITHAAPHMIEFTSYVKEILNSSGFVNSGPLPYEELIAQFSNENGKDILLPWFEKVESKKIKSSLLFREEDYQDFEKYIRFKQSFFIPGNIQNQDLLTAILLNKIKTDLKNSGEMKISKEDIIFVCTNPKP